MINILIIFGYICMIFFTARVWNRIGEYSRFIVSFGDLVQDGLFGLFWPITLPVAIFVLVCFGIEWIVNKFSE